MVMEKELLLKLLAVGPALVGTSWAVGASRSEYPNVVLILADDLGYGDLSCLNPDGKIPTRHIDSLARQGVVFTDAHSSSAVSTPSRYSLLTGRYNWRSRMKAGVLNGYSPALIDTTRSTLGSLLRRAGYETACIGKWHLGWNWTRNGKRQSDVDFAAPISCGPVDVGFDYYFGISASLDFPPYVYVENDRATMVPDRIQPAVTSDMEYMRSGPIAADFDPREVLPTLTAKSEAYIRNQSGSETPFFLYFPMTAPHTPILPTEEFLGKSGLNTYGDFVLMVDAMVGRVVEALKRSGQYDNTVIIFTSDNGCSPSADYPVLTARGHNPSWVLRGYKADLYDGGHRVPMIVSWPRGFAPHEVSQTVCYTDWMATLAALTGQRLAPDEGEDSYDLLPLLRHPDYPQTIREATVHHSINGSFAIRQGAWKLILSAGSAGWSYPRPKQDDAVIATLPPVQLYRLTDDLSEQRNLCAEYPEKVAALTALLWKYIRDGRSTPGPAQQNENEEKWPQLETIPLER